MSDYYGASIEIGGKVSRKNIEEMVSIINAHYIGQIGFEYGEESEDPFSADALIERITSEESLSFVGNAVRNGWFPELEQLLVENAIPFVRHSEASVEADTEMRVFTGEKDATYNATDRGDALANATQLNHFLHLIKDGRCDEAVSAIQEITVGHVLPPMRIEQEVA